MNVHPMNNQLPPNFDQPIRIVSHYDDVEGGSNNCCCCMAKNRTLQYVVTIFYFCVWIVIVMNFIYTLSYRGGSFLAPSKKYKYLTIILFLGYSITLFVIMMTAGANFFIKELCKIIIILKIISIVLSLIGYYLMVGVMFDRGNITSPYKVAAISLGIVWGVLEVFCILSVLRYKYGCETQINHPPSVSPMYQQNYPNVGSLNPIPQNYYQQPSNQNIPVGIPVN